MHGSFDTCNSWTLPSVPRHLLLIDSFFPESLLHKCSTTLISIIARFQLRHTFIPALGLPFLVGLGLQCASFVRKLYVAMTSPSVFHKALPSPLIHSHLPSHSPAQSPQPTHFAITNTNVLHPRLTSLNASPPLNEFAQDESRHPQHQHLEYNAID